MVEQSRHEGRIWRRATGIGAFVLFLAGLLVAIDLEELVVIVAAVAALCALAGALTLLLARYRRGLLHGVATGGTATAAGARRLAGTSGRAGRSAGLTLGAAGAGTARATRGAVQRSLPVLRRADEQLGIRVRSVATTSRRHAARAWEVVAADVHAHREAIRSSSPRAGEAVGPIAPKRSGERRPAVRRQARTPHRDRA
jgi:hypothetical protein